MKMKLALVALVTLSVVGCSSSAPESTQNVEAYIGVGNTDYDSQYHFGYNQGCKSAISVKADGGELASFKDKVLAGLDQFDAGWSAGAQACQDGTSRSMYTVKQG